MYNFKKYDDKTALFDIFSSKLVKELKILLENKKRVTLAVPGGSTPKPLFDQLSTVDIDWRRVVIIPTDERFVPESSLSSNSGLIRSSLLRNFAKKAKLISFYKPGYSIQELSNIISKELKSVLPIDICIVGMGSDMHTASIFPGSDRLADALDLNSNETVLPICSENLIETRLTLVARILRSANKLHVLLTGVEKKAALEFALKTNDSWEQAPVRSILFRDEEVNIHYAD